MKKSIDFVKVAGYRFRVTVTTHHDDGRQTHEDRIGRPRELAGWIRSVCSEKVATQILHEMEMC